MFLGPLLLITPQEVLSSGQAGMVQQLSEQLVKFEADVSALFRQAGLPDLASRGKRGSTAPEHLEAAGNTAPSGNGDADADGESAAVAAGEDGGGDDDDDDDDDVASDVTEPMNQADEGQEVATAGAQKDVAQSAVSGAKEDLGLKADNLLKALAGLIRKEGVRAGGAAVSAEGGAGRAPVVPLGLGAEDDEDEYADEDEPGEAGQALKGAAERGGQAQARAAAVGDDDEDDEGEEEAADEEEDEDREDGGDGRPLRLDEQLGK
jgi:hypothetical protein